MDTENVVNTPANRAPDYQKIFKLVGLAIAAVIVIAIVVSIISALLPGKFETPGKNYILSIENDEGEYSVVFNGKKPVTLDEDETKNIISVDSDYAQKNHFVLVSTEDDEEDDEDGISNVFYVMTGKGKDKIADDVDEYELSAFGDKIIYITADEDLYVGKASNAKKASKIDSEVDGISAVSPDGSAFVYYKIEESDDEEEETEIVYYLSKDGKKGSKYDSDKRIFAVSDKAKYVYYSETNDDGETTYYVNETKIAGKDESLYDTIFFNRDGSQAIINVSDEDGDVTCYIIEKDKKPVKLDKETCYGILAPEGADASCGEDVKAYNVASFAKCALNLSDGYYYLKNIAKGAPEKLSELNNATQIQLLDDGKTVIFIRKGNLKTADITKPNKEATEYASEEDIVLFQTTSDGKHIYALDEDETLFYVKSKKSMKKVAEDVTYNFSVVKDGKVYYINEDQELFRAKKSGSAKKVDEDVYAIAYIAEADDLYAFTEDALCTVSGTKAKKLIAIDIDDIG